MSIINILILHLVRCLKERRYNVKACMLFLPMILILSSIRLLVREE